MSARDEKILALKQKAKERAKAAKKAYFERPDVKARVEKMKADRREKAKALRKKRADELKLAKSDEKKSYKEAAARTRLERQHKRDEELSQMILTGSDITPPAKPSLRVINGGKPS